MGKLFYGGVPTEPEVTRLMKAMAPRIGDVVTFEDIEKIIGIRQTEGRFRTIVVAWRKKLFRESGLQTKGQNKSIVVMTPKQVVNERGVGGLHRAGRLLSKTHMSVSAIDDRDFEDDITRKTAALVRRESAAIIDQVRHSAKEIAAPRPKQPAIRLAK